LSELSVYTDVHQIRGGGLSQVFHKFVIHIRYVASFESRPPQLQILHFLKRKNGWNFQANI